MHYVFFIYFFFSIIHEDYEDTDAIIYSWGMAFWVPPVTTHTSCELDYSYWPWDIQKCNMVIGSWTKSGWEVDVFNMGQTDGTKNVGRGTHAGPKISPLDIYFPSNHNIHKSLYGLCFFFVFWLQTL